MDLFNLCMIFVGYAIICNYCNASGSCSISPNKQASDHCKTQSSSRLPIEDLIALIPDSLGSWEGRLSSDGDSTSIGNGDSKLSDDADANNVSEDISVDGDEEIIYGNTDRIILRKALYLLESPHHTWPYYYQ